MSSRVCLIIYDLPVYISSCLFSLMLSGLLVIPSVSCLVLLCPALMSLLNINLSLYPRLRVPVPPSCVHRDNARLKRWFFNLDLNWQSVSASRTVLGRLFQSLGAKYKTNLPPAVDINIDKLLLNSKSFDYAADMGDYNAIRARSSTEELSHSGLYK